MGFCSAKLAQSKGLEEILPRLNFPEQGEGLQGGIRPCRSEGEENASRGLFQSLVPPSVVTPLGQKNVPTAAPQSPEGSPKELKCSYVRERLGDFTPTTGRGGERQITEAKRGSA